MIKPSVPPLYGPFSATFGAQTVLSELESIGRSNLTWPASPATELGRTVLSYSWQLHNEMKDNKGYSYNLMLENTPTEMKSIPILVEYPCLN